LTRVVQAERGNREVDARRIKRAWTEIFFRSVERYANFPKELRRDLEHNFVLFETDPVECTKSKDGTLKFLIRTADDYSVETVVIAHSRRATCCVSSQIGCQMGCKFCATGTMNLKGNLRSSEILEQVAFARAIFEMRNEDKRLRNVVFMGMGEPLQNYDNVKSAVECLTDRNLFGFGRHHVTVSTVGVVESMRRLTQDLPGISLALSLHAPSQAKREKIVPTATAWHIEKIMDAFDAHIAASNVYTKTSKAMMVEYVLLKGVNDTVSDAEELAILLRKRPVIVNIIPYNPNITAKLFGFEAPTTASAREFGKILIDRGLKVRLRVEHGQDIAAACGQLALVATRKKKKLPLPSSAPVRDIEDIRLVPENSVRRTGKHSAHRAAKYRKDIADDRSIGRRELVLHFLVGVSFCVSLCAFVAHIFLGA